jgi:hypothetical protein
MTLIKVNGNTEHIEDTSLQNLQRLVGGYIEEITLNQSHIMIVNEEGRIMDLPINQVASQYYNEVTNTISGFIVGDVLIGSPEELN